MITKVDESREITEQGADGKEGVHGIEVGNHEACIFYYTEGVFTVRFSMRI